MSGFLTGAVTYIAVAVAGQKTFDLHIELLFSQVFAFRHKILLQRLRLAE